MRSLIGYQAIVKVVELYADGRMTNGDSSALCKGGWQFKIDREECLRAVAEAVIVSEALCGTVAGCDLDDPPRASRALHPKAVLEPSVIEAYLEQDDRVFHVAYPEELMEAECFVPRPGSCCATARAGPLDGSAGEEVKQASTLTYAQKKKMQRAQRVEAGELDLESEVLDPQYAAVSYTHLTLPTKA